MKHACNAATTTVCVADAPHSLNRWAYDLALGFALPPTNRPTVGIGRPGTLFPRDHAAFVAAPGLPSGEVGLEFPDYARFERHLADLIPGCPDPMWHFRMCCGCPDHYPWFYTLPGAGPVTLASGSAALELHTVKPDDTAPAPLAEGGQVPEGHLVTAIGVIPSLWPDDATVRFTQEWEDGQTGEAVYHFTVMDIKIWPDLEGDGSAISYYGEMENWAAAKARGEGVWNVPAGGAASVFELEDLVWLEGYWTIRLDGGTSPDDAVVLFGDGIAPVAVGCGESAEFDAWELRDLSHFIAYDPGDYTLTVTFTGTGSGTNYNLTASLDIRAVDLEIKITHPMGSSPFGSRAKYNGTPRNGSANNLFSTWPGELLRMNVVLPPSFDTNNLPQGAIVWTASNGESIQDNSLSHTFNWSSTGIKTVTIDFPHWDVSRKIIHVDVPDVGNMSETAATMLLSLANPNAITSINQARSEALASAAVYGITPLGDAFRHAYWTAYSASDIWVSEQEILFFSTAHEHSNRATGQQAFNTTMDLHNNGVGAAININNGFIPDANAIRAAVLQRYENGDLWIWRGDGAQETSEGVLIRSNGRKIFSN